MTLLISCSQSLPNYIDNDLPGNEPKIFAHHFISKDSTAEYGSVFNKAVNKFYFAVDTAGKSELRFSKLKNGKWTNPEIILQDDQYSFNDPFLSPDETKLYYISDKPRNSKDTIDDIDIWYSEITPQGLSKPINAGHEINSDGHEFYISFTNDGSMYFATNKENYPERDHDLDIYKSQFDNGSFQTPQKLSDSINARYYDADVFIAPDESYIIFCSVRRPGFGIGDLYISFKDKNDEWAKAVNMGESINSEHHEICPFVTHDGKYLFYTSNQDIYWVSTEILDRYR